LGGPEAAGKAWVGVVMGGMVGKTATPAMHKPARKSSPKGWVGWDKKKDLEGSRGFSEPYSKGLSDRNEDGGS